jgi:hypothetical protein
MHHFSKFCEEHKPAKPAREVQTPEKEGTVSRETIRAAVKTVREAVKTDVTPEQRAAFKEASAPTETIAEQRIREIRESRKNKRVEIGGHATRLDAKLPPGMKGRWVNDVNGRPKYLQDERGYTFVTEDMAGVSAHNTGMGGNISQTVGTMEGGGGLSGVLMMIPEEIYEEDQATKRGALDDIDSALNRGETPDSDEQDMSQRYSDLKISRG